jgi:O-antigen/teichoic acid export membrane protein
MNGIRKKTLALLKWSERYTKTDMSYLARGGSWLLSGHIASTLAGLVLTIAFANLLPKEVYGNYKFIVAVTGVVGALTLTGLSSAITQATAKGYVGMLKQAFRVQNKWAFIPFVVLLAISSYYFFRGNTEFGISFSIAALTMPLLASFSLYDPYLYGKHRFRESSIYNAIRNIIPPVSIVTLLVLFDPRIPLLMTVYFLSLLLPAIAFFFRVYREITNERETKDDTPIRYGKHLSAMNILSTVGAQADKLLVFYILGPIQLAIYAFATGIPSQIQALNKLLNPLLLPKLSTRSIKELQASMHHKALLSFSFGSVLLIAYAVSAPFLFQFLFPQYMESVHYSQVYALSFLFIPLSLYGQALISQCATRELYTINTTIPVLRVILLALLLPAYGIWGAVWAHLGSRTINRFVHAVLFYRIKPTPNLEPL